MNIKNIDLSLIRASMIVNRKKVCVNYTGVNCYAYALNISLLPESLNLCFYNPGIFAGKKRKKINLETLLSDVEEDFKTLGLSYKKTSPIFSLKKDDSWKIRMYVKYNKDGNSQEKLAQLGGADDILDVHFVKMQDRKITNKYGYTSPVKPFSKKEIKEKGYKYVKTYKVKIK